MYRFIFDCFTIHNSENLRKSLQIAKNCNTQDKNILLNNVTVGKVSFNVNIFSYFFSLIHFCIFAFLFKILYIYQKINRLKTIKNVKKSYILCNSCK